MHRYPVILRENILSYFDSEFSGIIFRQMARVEDQSNVSFLVSVVSSGKLQTSAPKERMKLARGSGLEPTRVAATITVIIPGVNKC
jgi:hypothetical protein